jgi:hypothetical protein
MVRRGLFQPQLLDDSFCSGLLYLFMTGYRLDVLTVGINIVISAVSEISPAVLLEKIYKVSLLHVLTS